MAAYVSQTSIRSQDTESAESLSSAIGEFRKEFLAWIDTELARLQAGDPEASLVGDERSTGARSIRSGLRGGSHAVPPTNSDGSRPGRPDPLSEMGRENPRGGERSADRSAQAEIHEPAVAVPGPETDPQPQADPGNPRQRLEALARLLDHRLKQGEGPVGTSRGATSGSSNGAHDEAPGLSGRRAVEWTSGADGTVE